MHSEIIQITLERVGKESTLNQNTLDTVGEEYSIDYTRDLSKQERREAIDRFVASLPQGMFSLKDDGETLVYMGGMDAFKQKWIDEIRAKANEITPDNIFDWVGSRWQLTNLLKNPLKMDVRFYMSDYDDVYTYKSLEFMERVAGLKEGTELYIGGVVDYHF